SLDRDGGGAAGARAAARGPPAAGTGLEDSRGQRSEGRRARGHRVRAGPRGVEHRRPAAGALAGPNGARELREAGDAPRPGDTRDRSVADGTPMSARDSRSTTRGRAGSRVSSTASEPIGGLGQPTRRLRPGLVLLFPRGDGIPETWRLTGPLS